MADDADAAFELLAHLAKQGMSFLEWCRNAEVFLEKWERVGPVEDNTWTPRT